MNANNYTGITITSLIRPASCPYNGTYITRPIGPTSYRDVNNDTGRLVAGKKVKRVLLAKAR